MRVSALACILVLVSGAAFAQTPKLMLFGGGGHDVYLGCINCNQFASDSLCNEFGRYGNEFSGDSIWNEFSRFGIIFDHLLVSHLHPIQNFFEKVIHLNFTKDLMIFIHKI